MSIEAIAPSPPAPSAAQPAAAPTEQKSVSTAVRIQSFGVTGLFILASIYAIYWSKPILMPVVAAVVLYIVLWPPVRLLGRFGVPTALGD